jgi:uronate dehydrogenase
MARLARCCIEAPPDLAFGVFYGVSANRWRIWDIDDARRAIGYEPRDDAEVWRGEIDSPASVSGSRRDRRRTLMAAFARSRKAAACGSP